MYIMNQVFTSIESAYNEIRVWWFAVGDITVVMIMEFYDYSGFSYSEKVELVLPLD